jgi:hypothetical protein
LFVLKAILRLLKPQAATALRVLRAGCFRGSRSGIGDS